jgi:2-polyprenyl-6-methoxyphenol hydroxylase-like FAD-dependent oxidoreductase
MIRVERFRLREWLRTNIDIQWNKHAVRFDHDDSGVSVYFADGTCSKGDILVGADGTNSRVREYLLGRPNSELLKTIPYAIIVGEVTLIGEDFRQQLELGHSGYNLMSSQKDFVSFNGLHKVLPDGLSGRYFWIFMQPDAKIDEDDHWIRNASQKEKLDHVLKTVALLKPRFRRLFELTSSDGIKKEGHFFRDLELDPNQLPSGRLVLMGDAAHCMAPFRGEGGYHSIIDGMRLAKVLGRLKEENSIADIKTVKSMVTEYNVEMITRGSAAVRNSRNGNKELMDKIAVLTLLLKWAPWLLTLLFRLGPQTQLRVGYMPAEKVVLPGDAPRAKGRAASSWLLLALLIAFLAFIVSLRDTSLTSR